MRLPLARTLAVAALALAASGTASADGLSGNVYVAESDGVEINGNTFTDRQDVYIYGTGHAEGEYYVKVLSTEDNSLLGTSIGSSDETPVVVGADGNFAEVYQLWSLVIKASDGTQGYDTPVAPWCEYRVVLGSDSDFQNSCADPFIVKEQQEEEKGKICVKKFYDANANGVRDDGEAFIEGWLVHVSTGTDVYTTSNEEYTAGDYTFTEGTATGDHWIATTATEVSVTLADGDELTVEFGNVCIGEGGGLTPGFWSNKNGLALITSADLSALSALNLVKASGAAFNPGTKDALKNWLLNRDATNMSYMLSAHLAAMTLNVRHGFVDGDAIVYAPGVGNTGVGDDFISISDLLDAANAALGADGYTLSGDPNRATQEALKNALDNANNDLNFVQDEACDFSF